MRLLDKKLDGKNWELTNGVWFYRQPGGCLEIGKLPDNPGDEQDLVHICLDDVPRFMQLLVQFEQDTR